MTTLVNRLSNHDFSTFILLFTIIVASRSICRSSKAHFSKYGEKISDSFVKNIN